MQARPHRRTFCKLTGMAAMTAWLDGRADAASPLQAAHGSAMDENGSAVAPDKVRIHLRWRGEVCRPQITNVSATRVRLRQVVLLEYTHSLPPETAIYGESFQMLTQTVGTLASIREIGYAEQQHYRIPGPKDAAVVTSLLTLSPPGREHLVLAYTSCKKFIGRFYVRNGNIAAVVDTEGLALEPGESWELEELRYLHGNDREDLLAQVADGLNEHHPHRMFKSVPTGWCSWYCFGRGTTAEDVTANLDVMSETLPALRYVQIDDGYQPAMGDWLDPGRSFGGKIQDVLKDIRRKGFEPAIWVATFIANTNSRVLREHPEWFVKDDAGEPMAAAKVTFTGWGRRWMVLPGWHPSRGPEAL